MDHRRRKPGRGSRQPDLSRFPLRLHDHLRQPIKHATLPLRGRRQDLDRGGAGTVPSKRLQSLVGFGEPSGIERDHVSPGLEETPVEREFIADRVGFQVLPQRMAIHVDRLRISDAAQHQLNRRSILAGRQIESSAIHADRWIDPTLVPAGIPGLLPPGVVEARRRLRATGSRIDGVGAPLRH